MGRPAVLDKPRTVPVKIEEADIKRATRLAAREGVTYAEIIRRALKAYLRRREP